eukprot:5465125-Prymnesium_polylepis.1
MRQCGGGSACAVCGRRRAEGGEPPARSCTARCARRRVHGDRARRTARVCRAAADRGAVASLRCEAWGACGCAWPCSEGCARHA